MGPTGKHYLSRNSLVLLFLVHSGTNSIVYQTQIAVWKVKVLLRLLVVMMKRKCEA
jgi:hypothetical protein